MRALRLSAISVPALAVTAFVLVPALAAQTDWQKSYPVSGKPSVTLSTGDASTDVHSCAACREVRIRVQWNDRHPDEYTVTEFQSGDHVNFDLKEKQRFGIHISMARHEPQVIVETPREVDLEARTSDGGLKVYGVNGGISLHTSDGAVDVEDVSGALRLVASDGSIRIHNVTGTLESKSSDGRVSIDGRLSGLQVHTSDGNLDLTLAEGSQLTTGSRIEASDGRVMIRLPKALAADLDIHTGDGHIDCQLPLTMSGYNSGGGHNIRGRLNAGEKGDHKSLMRDPWTPITLIHLIRNRRMARFRIPLAVLAFCVTGLGAAAASHAPTRQIVAYVFPQNNVLQPGQIDPHQLTRINYAFANIVNGRMVPGFAHDAENFAYLESLKKENPSITVLVSVGGWLWSTNFSDMALTAKSRALFIQSVMEFLTQYHLDGLDVDWEYPGMTGSGHPFRPEDKQNFTLLLKELRARFARETASTHRRLYLTFAAGATEDFLSHTEMGKAQQYVDTVNLMAYDYYEAGSDANTGNHAPLFTDPADPKKISADASVRAFEKAGVPAQKIILGVAFYGREWGQVPKVNHGLFQPGKSAPTAYVTYAVIAQDMLNQSGYVRYWDDKASAPYLYNPGQQIFVSYEDPESLAAKCRYVVTQNLGGIMFWEYSNDPSGTLLRAIEDSLHQQPAKASDRP